jgi:hypothetical protein
VATSHRESVSGKPFSSAISCKFARQPWLCVKKQAKALTGKEIFWYYRRFSGFSF